MSTLRVAFLSFMLAVPSVLVAQGVAPVRGFPSDVLTGRAELERILRETPDTARLREYMLAMTEEPHHAGFPGSKKVALYALEKFKSWGLDARIEEFRALMPVPVSRRVELLSPTNYVAALKEPVIAEDKDSGDENQLPTYNAYSADGDVTGDLVFVNYGVPDDYRVLDSLGIDVKGKIVIAKYGRSWRGIKPKVAREHGAIATILYSDPEDDGYYVDDVYPRGPMRPEMGVQRGSVMDMPTYPGDPLTPGRGNREGTEMLERSEAPTLMQIPVIPISYGDAQPLLEALGGPVAPGDDWKGALPLTYHVGPGPARVRVALSFDWQVRPLYNVIVRIPGRVDRDQWVLHGNHHDAWVNGANDPISGAVALMETARSFAALLKTGWKPRRTLVLALWDGEEWGLLGSTEWAEYHAQELDEKAVAYFNSDTNSRGWMRASGSHSLETFIRQVVRDTRDPVTGMSALDTRLNHDLERAKTEKDSTRIRERGFRLGALGSGSDYTVFIDHLAVASVDMRHGGAQNAGVYHSIYDSYDFYTRFYDPGFLYGRAQAGAMGVALLRMLDAPVLPFSFSDAARTYREYLAEIDSLIAAKKLSGIDLAELGDAVEDLAQAGKAYDEALNAVLAKGEKWLSGKKKDLRRINKQIYRSERDLITAAGLPRREWYHHSIYAPGFYTGYGVKTMPGVREAVEQGNVPEALGQAKVITEGLNRLSERVRRITGQFSRLQ